MRKKLPWERGLLRRHSACSLLHARSNASYGQLKKLHAKKFFLQGGLKRSIPLRKDRLQIKMELRKLSFYGRCEKELFPAL
jgi:hypothetical protein